MVKDELSDRVGSTPRVSPSFGESRHRLNARQMLAKVKQLRRGKRFMLVKVNDRPATWKEVELKKGEHSKHIKIKEYPGGKNAI